MLESKLRAFCESRHRWLIVIFITLGLGIVAFLPLVDDYCAGKMEKTECIGNLQLARHEEANFDKLKSRFDEMTARLDQMKGRTVTRDTVNEYRSRIVDRARLTGCQLRRLTAGVPQSRPWSKEDDLFDETSSKDHRTKPADFIIGRQPLHLSVSGSMRSLKALLKEIRGDRQLMHIRSMDFHTSGTQRKQVILDLELLFYDIKLRAAKAS